MTDDLKEDERALFHAIYKSDFIKAKELIFGGTNSAVEDPFSGMQPIHLAASLGDVEVIDILLREKNLRADTVDRRGKTPYEWAMDYKQNKAEMLLINEIIRDPKRYGKTSVALAKMHLNRLFDFV